MFERGQHGHPCLRHWAGMSKGDNSSSLAPPHQQSDHLIFLDASGSPNFFVGKVPFQCMSHYDRWEKWSPPKRHYCCAHYARGPSVVTSGHFNDQQKLGDSEHLNHHHQIIIIMIRS